MADDANPACREWLGIEPADLALPHVLLGVAGGECDPLAIVRAADRRLALLRAVAPDRTVERDVLLAQVEAARDAMLAAAVEGRAASPPAPPPVPSVSGLVPPPPPVPAAVVPAPPPVPPAADPDGEDALAAGDVRVPRVRFIRRRRADHGAAALGIASLAIAAATLAVYVAWPHLQNSRHVARTHGHEASPPPTPASTAGSKPDTARAPKPAPETTTRVRPATQPSPRQTSDPQPAPEPAPQPTRDSPPPPLPRPTPEPVAQPAPRPEPAEPEKPAVDVDAVRGLVGEAVTTAFDALQQRDFVAAKQALAAVADRALDDQQATDRLQRWQQLTVYAEGYPEHRDKAFANALKGREFEVDGRRVGVAEGETPGTFSIRDRGRNRPVTRDAMPPNLEHAIVAQWFAADGRPANHLFLGAAAISRREPDTRTARKEWETAAAGGEPDGRLLLGILDDPVVRGR